MKNNQIVNHRICLKCKQRSVDLNSLLNSRKIRTSVICITNLGQNEWMTPPVMPLSTLSPVIMGMCTTNHRGTHINKHVQRFSIFMWPLKIFFPSSKLMRSNLDMWTISTVQTFLQNSPFFYITCLRNITTTNMTIDLCQIPEAILSQV